ncbi:pentapeptide repeat-containing protein [Propionibacteriaceae bacterium Y1685]
MTPRRGIWSVSPSIPADLPEVSQVSIVDDAVITDQQVVRADGSGARARLVDLETLRWHGSSLSGAQIDKLSLTDCAFTECDLAVLAAPESSWNRVLLANCRMSGFSAAGATVQYVEVTDAVADLASWRFARLTRVRFTGGRWTQADFVGTTFDDVVFTDCDLTRADFSQAVVKKARFDNCRFDGVGGMDSLRRSVISYDDPTDALGLLGPMAHGLGITLED